MVEFEWQAEMMDRKEEMIKDATEDAKGDEAVEEERYGETEWEGGDALLVLDPCIALIKFFLFPSDAFVCQVLGKLD